MHDAVRAMPRLATVALLATTAAAQTRPTTPDSAATLPGVTVTASRSGLAAALAPLAITKVTPAQWRGTSGYGIDDALSLVPGVLAQSRYGNGDIRLTIRGFGSRGAGDRSNSGTSRGVRILVNGIPETEPDGRTSMDGLDLASATGIEIVRSNASALWGNAAGGVININTVPEFDRSFFEEENIIGGWGMKRIAVRGGALVGTAKVYGSAVNSSMDGWRGNSMSSRMIFDGGVVAPLGDHTTLKALLLASFNRFNVPGPLTQAQVDADPSQANATYLARRERRDNRLARVGLTLDHAIDANQGFSAMAFVTPKYLQRSERNTYRDFNRYHLGGNGVYRVAGQYADGVKGTLSIGTDAAYQDGTILFYTLSATQGRGTTLSDNKREGANNFGVFVNDDLELGDRWLLGLGARYDAVTYTYSSNITPSLNTTKGFTGVSPKVGLTFKAGTGHTWYANVGGGIEVPAGNETDPEAGTPNAVYAINPLLDPIRSTTFEIGTRRVIGFVDSPVRSLRYDVAAFRTMVSNEIVPYNGGRFYFSAAKAERTGLEVGATADLVGGWSVQGAATLMNAQYKNYVVDSVHYAKPGKSADYSNNDVVGVPSSTINATLGWAPAALGGLRLQGGISTTSSYFVDDANKVKVPAATVYNASIVTDRAYLLGNGIGVRGAVRVQNLTDRRYIASAFLNPDLLSGAPVAYEPGLPRQVIFTLSFERMR